MNQDLGMIQRLLGAILPTEPFQQLEAESREWIMTCSQCGAQRSIWDAGEVRWRAKGERTFHARCMNCGRTAPHRWSDDLLNNAGGHQQAFKGVALSHLNQLMLLVPPEVHAAVAVAAEVRGNRSNQWATEAFSKAVRA